MNSFKPLTIYKGFVVPEEYVSGAMDSFDVVKYLEQIGLNKESKAFLSTLKTIKIPPGIEVINTKTNDTYTANDNKRFPVTQLDGTNSPTWDDFVKYANKPDAHWNIVDASDFTEEDINFVRTTEINLEQFLSDENFSAAKKYLKQAKQQQSQNESVLNRLEVLSSIVDSLEQQQNESEAGLNDVSLAEKLDLKNLVSKHEEFYVTLKFEGGGVKVKKATKFYYQESIDLGLIASLLDAAGFTEEAKAVEEEINALAKKEKTTVNFTLNSLFEFFPADRRRQLSTIFINDLRKNILHPEFYEKFEDYHPNMLDNPRKKQEIGDHNRPIIQSRDPDHKTFEGTESKKTRRAGHLLDAIERYEQLASSEQDKGKKLNEKFRSEVTRAKILSQQVKDASSTDRSLEEHEAIREKDADEQIRVLSAKFFSSGRTLWELLFKSKEKGKGSTQEHKEDVNRIFQDYFELKDSNGVRSNITLKSLYLAKFDTHTLVAKDLKIADSRLFAQDMQSREGFWTFIHSKIKETLPKSLKDRYERGLLNVGSITKDRIKYIAAYAYLTHQYSGTKKMSDFIERDNMLHTNEFLTLMLGKDFNTDFISGIIEDPNNPDAYFPIQVLVGMRFLPFIPGQNKLDFDTETRQKLLRNSGLDALGYGPKIFDDISGNAVPLRRALRTLFDSNFSDAHEKHVSNLLKRVSRSATNSNGITILDEKTVNGSTIGTVDVLPGDFDSPENIESVTNQIFTENTFSALTSGTPEERQEAKTTIMNKFKAFLKVNDEDRIVLEKFAEQIIDNAIEDQTKKSKDKDDTGKVGFFFEDVGLIPLLATYAQAGSMKNISAGVPERFSDNSDANNSFYETKGFSWTMTNADGQEEDYVLGGPKSTGSAGDSFLTKFNFETGKMETQIIEIKQEKEAKSAGHLGQTTKMVKYIFDSLKSFFKSFKSPEQRVSLSLRPSLNISIPHQEGKKPSVDRVQNKVNLSSTTESYKIRGVVNYPGELYKRNQT